MKFSGKFVAAVRNIISPSILISKPNVMPGKKVSPMTTYNVNAFKHIDQLKLGRLVSHQAFGQGKIVAITSSSIDIQFHGTIRTLSIEVCLTKGILEPA